MDRSLRINSINDLISMFEGWEQVQELAEHLSGVRAQLIDSSGKIVSGREFLPDICRLIQSTKVGEARCRDCYEKAALSSSAAKLRHSTFRCHAGLENIVFPLSLEGMPAGAIACGRALSASSRPGDREFQQKARDLGLDPSEIEKAVDRLTTLGSADLNAFAKVLQPFVDDMGATIFRYFSLIEKSEDLITASKESESLLSVDRMTGLFNRRYFDDRAASEVSRANRYGHPVALVMLELDDFDTKTDSYGLIAKDIIMREAAEILTKTARATEVVVRYDDARFAVIMPECDHEQAFRFAERVRKNIAVKVFGKDAGLDMALTASVGVAALYQEVTVENLAERAEHALTQAKNDGGNKIRLVPLKNAVIENARTAHIYTPDSTKKRRVVITGVGPIAPNGIGKEAFWNTLKNGRSGISRISGFDPSSLPVQIAGEIRDFDPLQFVSAKDARRMDRFTQLSISATALAQEDANLDLSSSNRDRVGVSVGTAIGGVSFAEEQAALLREFGYKKVSPFLILSLFPGAGSSQVSQAFGITAPSATASTGCPAGADAIAYAYDAIVKGEADVMFAGGAEAPVMPAAIAGFAVMGALSTQNQDPRSASRPFDASRDGFVLAEGAGILVLEEMSHAETRSARIYGELLGYGTTCDAYHMTRPAPDGIQAQRAIELALSASKLKPTDIDYINAHGSSTPLNDVIETRTIKGVFGDHSAALAINSTKSIIGHSMGGAGGLEFIATVLSIEQGFLHPTINYQNPDPDCDLDYVPNIGRASNIKNAISTSYGFGGKNTVLVASKFNA